LRTLQALGVPQGAVVYFTVDTDVDNNAYVIPYFEAAKQAPDGTYRIGAYGCGATSASSSTKGAPPSSGQQEISLAISRDRRRTG
jgi:Domain of unknown function (DUF1906)